MFLLDDLLIGGLRFVLDKVAAVAEQELDSVDSLNRALVEAQAQLEDGTLSDDEFAAAEQSILARLRALKDQRPGGLADADSFDGIEVAIDDDRHS